LLGSDTGLMQRGCVDQVANRFGLWKIDPAVYERAQGELAWLGGAGSLFESLGHPMTQDNRRAVTGDLDDVFRGVRTRSGEIGDDHVIYCLSLLIK
jgi:hypothetical protein